MSNISIETLLAILLPIGILIIKIPVHIKLIINKGHIDLVETLSYEILSNIFSDSRASKVWLKIEKLDVFAEAQSVGLEIIKTRKNFIESSNSQNMKKLKNK